MSLCRSLPGLARISAVYRFNARRIPTADPSVVVAVVTDTSLSFMFDYRKSRELWTEVAA